MRFSSLHTHSVFCDGEANVETLCRAAWEKGLCSIGFSSHAPIFEKTGMETDWHVRGDRFGAYVEEVLSAKKRWEGRLAVFLGVEADYIEGGTGPLDWADWGLDYIIGSVHYVVPPRGRPFTVDGGLEEFKTGLREGFGGDGEALAACYWETLLRMIAAGGFDILGHADLVKKNNLNECFFRRDGGAYSGLAKEAAFAAAGFTVEINMGGINRGKISESYPSVALLRLFRQAGVPAVITADAHVPHDLDGHYPLAVELLQMAGYKEHRLFRGRRDGKAFWEDEPITNEVFPLSTR